MKIKEKKKKVFSGTLFLVVGNSGSGKDSIIKTVLERYPSDLKSIRLTQRYITRPPSKDEDNISINPEKFREMSKQGKFALEWHIYGLDYGVPIERLKARARESGKRLEERIERAKKNQKFADADFIVDNSEELENAVNQFLKYLVSVVRGKELF